MILEPNPTTTTHQAPQTTHQKQKPNTKHHVPCTTPLHTQIEHRAQAFEFAVLGKSYTFNHWDASTVTNAADLHCFVRVNITVCIPAPVMQSVDTHCKLDGSGGIRSPESDVTHLVFCARVLSSDFEVPFQLWVVRLGFILHLWPLVF
jgi:hypothetical protein